MTPFLINKYRAAEVLGVSISTIYRREKAGDFAKRRRTGNSNVRYALIDVINWKLVDLQKSATSSRRSQRMSIDTPIHPDFRELARKRTEERLNRGAE